MDTNKLKNILANHAKWLNGESDGIRADLLGADLREANLREANLQRANLQEANLQGANLQEANLDFSCWPLWCGSLRVEADKRLAVQLAYHFCSLLCDDAEYIQARDGLLSFANQMHRLDVPKLY